MDLPDRPSLRRAGSGEGSTTSIDSHPSRNLLFGEIDSSASFVSGRSRSNSSVCNLVLSSNQAFLRFWHSEDCREAFLKRCDRPTLREARLVCHDFAAKTAPFLFKELSVHFKPTSFTKTRRMIALKKIGHHALKFTFRMPHSSETFLPPLLDPVTGEQHSFTYVPQIERPSTPTDGSRVAKYGSEEITNMLISQYPPLFHAATNIPAFIRALSYMRNIRHIVISCPGQEEPQLHRRSVVDYALISLRIAIERASLDDFEALTLESIHPAALFYLQPIHGIGSTPSSQRRWSQVEQLSVHMTSFPFDDPDRTEHLRILHAYLRAFSQNLTSLHFSWVGKQSGPSPLTLDKEPVLLQSTTDGQPAALPKALRFPKLRYMVLNNAVMDSSQVASFISRHKKRLVEFNFEEVTLRSGDWDHALKPLRKSRYAAKPLSSVAQEAQYMPESMDVPCVWSPIEAEPEPRIMETLEPQYQFAAPSQRGGFSVSKWLAIRPGKRLQKKEPSTASSHLRKALFSWR
ncbi:uncharacterized protein PV09_00841 [Verruconis gallopava]|uniref:Uncharacterized protein n=1 Tax=Verruconis gallopava TaxID=253628 RepID=A0A0D2BC35_9PEZI|nr:uncharacterized protein PV09_00841 [Verruconis gallopava]KIW08924.1 hypothetical protein PV09_00841 [Verruconis gallopava]